MKKLNLGCGDKILPGYVNVDVAASRRGLKPDVLCDLHQLTPFENDSVDEILSVHVVEHFWRWEVVAVLREWVRVLKPGGSALFFADLLAAGGREGGVISVDVTHEALNPMVTAHPRIRFLLGDSAADSILQQAMDLIPARRQGGLLLILDSDHAATHVLRELTAWVPLLRCGDYVIVEDTIVNGHPVRPEFGPGPFEAVADYLAQNPHRLQADDAREAKFGCTFAHRGYFKIV